MQNPKVFLRSFLLCHTLKHTLALKTNKTRDNWASLAWMPLVPLLPVAHWHRVKAITSRVAVSSIKKKQWDISHPLWGSCLPSCLPIFSWLHVHFVCCCRTAGAALFCFVPQGMWRSSGVRPGKMQQMQNLKQSQNTSDIFMETDRWM